MSPSTGMADVRRRAHGICRDYLHGAWQLISPDDMLIKPICGGLSNLLYLCELPSSQPPLADEPRRALLRIHGQAHGTAYESITESVIFTLLAERRLGPRLYAIFPGGRLEEYMEAISIPVGEMRDPETTEEIAKHMATVHSLQIPICKEPTVLWQNMKKWLQLSVNTLSDKTLPTDGDRADLIEEMRRCDFEAEINWLRRYFSRAGSAVVFCHNDVQEGNLLRHNGSRRLTLIDYEYCCYNYRGFDIANHFCEWMYDYTAPEYPHYTETAANWPSRDEQLRFTRAYLRHRDSHSLTPPDDRSGGKPVQQRSAEEEEAILDEVHVYVLASHLFWTLWSIVNASNSSIAFGYWEYGMSRLRAYRAVQQELARTDPRCPPLVHAPASVSVTNRVGHVLPAEPCAVHVQ